MALFAQFTETRKVVPNGPTYMKGKVYKMDRASIEHWVNRGIAFECGDPGAVKKKPGRPKKDDKPQSKSTTTVVSKPVEEPEVDTASDGVVAERKHPIQDGDPESGRAIREDGSIAGVDAPNVASKDEWPSRP